MPMPTTQNTIKEVEVFLDDDVKESQKVSDDVIKKLKPIETSSISVDLDKYDKKETIIEKIEVIKVPSKFSESPDKMQWVLKVSSQVLETLGEGLDKIEFRASELFNLVQDKEGKLLGYPTGEGSNLQKFIKDVKAKDMMDLKGKKALIKSYKVLKDGREKTYLKFRF